MKQTIRISALAAALLVGGTFTLFAQTAPMKDDVAAKATKAITTPTAVSGEHAAKAAVEEANAKEEFEAKMAARAFMNDARQARAERLGHALDREAKLHADPGSAAPQSILEGIGLTLQAAQFIQTGEKDKAISALEKASKDFAAALKADPSLDRVPFSQEIQVRSFAGDSTIIQKALDTAETLVHKRHTQDARAILNPLQDEMDFITQLLPMKTYPLATRKAAEALKQGQERAALALLGEAFGTVVVTVDVIPLPLMLAREDILTASELKAADAPKAKALLQDAQEELRRATLLGYTYRHAAAYQALNDQIKALQKAIDGGNPVTKLYDTLKADVEKLFHSLRDESRTVDKAARQDIARYQARETVQARKEAPAFEKAASKDANKTLR